MSVSRTSPATIKPVEEPHYDLCRKNRSQSSQRAAQHRSPDSRRQSDYPRRTPVPADKNGVVTKEDELEFELMELKLRSKARYSSGKPARFQRVLLDAVTRDSCRPRNSSAPEF